MLPERARVGGTVKPALDGALVGMVAGDRATFVRPLLDEMTRRLDFLGDVGNAAAMKLAINLPLMVYWGALGEAVALLGRHNIDVEQAFDILTDSSGAIGPAKARQGPIIDLIKNGQSVSNFAIDQAIKDMNLMKSQAGQCGFECQSSPRPWTRRRGLRMPAGIKKIFHYSPHGAQEAIKRSLKSLTAWMWLSYRACFH